MPRCRRGPTAKVVPCNPLIPPSESVFEPKPPPPYLIGSNPVGALVNVLPGVAGPVVESVGGPLRLLPGQIGGRVGDATGAVIPNANVTLSSSNGYHGMVRTNSDGWWSAYGVPSGKVKVQLDSPGFVTQVQNLAFDFNSPQQVNTTLQLGAVSETVELTASSSEVSGRDVRNLAKRNKQAQMAQTAPSENVVNLQKRVAGVLPIAVDVPPPAPRSTLCARWSSTRKPK